MTLLQSLASSRVIFASYILICLFIFHYLYLAKTGSLPYTQVHPSATGNQPEPQPERKIILSNTYTPEVEVPKRTNSTRRRKPDIPRKIWQTSKTGPGGLDKATRVSLNTWTELNQKWRYESMTQFGAESYVRDRFPDRPEFLETFLDLQDPILRADMIRYLVLLGDGGVYSDLDTNNLKPIRDWIPAQFKGSVSVVVGIEYDKLDGNRWADWTLDLQFCTWAIMARPGHSLFERTVTRIIKGLHELAQKQGKTIAGVKVTFADVLNTTGPALFTQAVFEYLSDATGTDFTWLNVTGLTQPILVDDILILPITAFGSGQGHSNSGSPEDDEALVEHLFAGTWKGSHPLYEDES